MVDAAWSMRSRQMPASFGVQGPGDSTMASGSAATRRRRDLVVAMHDHLGPQLAEVMDEVEGEAVVVVDEDDHSFHPRPPGPRRDACLGSARPWEGHA